MKHQIILSLGSNYDAEQNLLEARSSLEQILSVDSQTPTIWTDPIGCQSASQYLNQLIKANTNLSLSQLNILLKDIECRMGRSQADRQQHIVRIDIDILQYDSDRYHLRDWQRPYVMQLLPYLNLNWSPTLSE